MTNVIKNTQKNEEDWSLSANGKIYDDNKANSAKLTKRLKNSSSSVIGIAGQRGVGKSSLALRVLANCSEAGSFTHLIHSPTRYDPQDFLVSVFQAVCEEVVEKVNEYFLEADSLLKRGEAELRRLRRMHRARLLAFPIALILIFLLYSIYPFTSDTVLGFIIIIVMLITVIAIFMIGRYVMPVGLRIRNVKKNLEIAGLRDTALRHSKYLSFQTTLSRSSEIGLSVSKTTSKFRTGENLAARPLTLPSLATQFAQFLREIGEVYSKGPVVICLDELDKIENPKDLDKLLRGIKGLLGEPRTHFLLTVSEDALSRFIRQRRMKRGILESAFDDIVLLDRVRLQSTKNIVEPLFNKPDNSKTKEAVESSTEILWLFGNAIPREIKRNALLVCPANEHPPNPLTPIEVWKLLFRSRMDDMKSWSLHVGGDNNITYQFLSCLQESIDLMSDSNNEAKFDFEWGKDLVALWMQQYKILSPNDHQKRIIQTESNDALNDGQNSDRLNATRDSDASPLAFGRAIIEILLGASALVYVLKNNQRKLLDSSVEQQLYKIFEFVPINLQLTWEMMEKYLTNIDLTTDV